MVTDATGHGRRRSRPPARWKAVETMRRVLAAVAAVILLPLAAAPASAAPPRIYHTIQADLAYAVVDVTVGCEHTTAWVSSSAGQYAAQPGPVTKQAFTDVLVVVTDACAVAAAAGPGEPVLAEYQGRAAVAPVMDPRLRSASVTAVVPVEGDPSTTIRLTASWTGVGELEHTTGHSHELFPGVGVVSGAGNELRRTAEAVVSVQVGDTVHLVAVPSVDAVLESVKAHCIEVPRPGVEEFFPCFGFPG